MAKLRHIAISVSDAEAAARFFEEAFGMTRAGTAMRGIYMTDGIINVALLNFGNEPVPGFESKKDYRGLIHFGMWVDSVEETDQKVKAAGGKYVTGRKETSPDVYYEIQALNRYLEYDPGYVNACKAALDLLGLPGGPVRAPMMPLTSGERAAIRRALRDLRLLGR